VDPRRNPQFWFATEADSTICHCGRGACAKPVPFPVKAALVPEATDAVGGVIVAVSELELGSPLPQPDKRQMEPRIKATYRRIYVPTLVGN
jgi:hypothetical protein